MTQKLGECVHPMVINSFQILVILSLLTGGSSSSLLLIPSFDLVCAPLTELQLLNCYFYLYVCILCVPICYYIIIIITLLLIPAIVGGNALRNNITFLVTSNARRYMTKQRVICNGYYIQKKRNSSECNALATSF